MAEMQVTQIDDVTVIRLSGELTGEGTGAVERGLVMTIAGASRVVIDLSALTMVTTPGITMLVAADRTLRRRNGKLVLCGLTGSPREVLLERCRLDVVFHIESNEAEAIASARA